MAPRPETNYWHDSGAADFTPPTSPLPQKVDIAVVGAGYTGLVAALHLARAGRSVALFEAGQIGHGASSRSGGMVGPSFHKLGVSGLISRYGETKALALLGEGMAALNFFEQFVADEKLDCDLQIKGRFRGARTTQHYDATARECEWLNKAVGLPYHMVSRAEQHEEIGSDFYHGGVVYHRDGGVHPRKLLVALANKCVEAGVSIHQSCAVLSLTSSDTGSSLKTTSGTLQAGEVVLATNGYSDGRTAAMHRRVVQIRTGAAVTEPLAPELMQELSPKARMHGESGRVFMWYRPTPDGKRFLFGGRMGRTNAAPEDRKAAIRASALRVFPQLANTSFSHVWSGLIAYTPDHIPHLGKKDGVWLAGGYCGSGVARTHYLATKLARRILGEKDAETAFDDLPFAPVPFKPFSGIGARVLTRWYQWQDDQDLKARFKAEAN